MTAKFTLEDAEARHAENPATFHLPDLEERQNLQPGQLAKLVFVAPEGQHDWVKAERMWVKVERRLDDGGYVGALDNYPLVIDADPGDPVRFEAKHVIDVGSPNA